LKLDHGLNTRFQDLVQACPFGGKKAGSATFPARPAAAMMRNDCINDLTKLPRVNEWAPNHRIGSYCQNRYAYDSADHLAQLNNGPFGR
jgi:hypothetical protein